ncbi:hypothetical protein [Thalassotalea sp. Y01]|uniref:hypothetical protein n=1 Tax=Thalassotalea sp. Y01 TaxID=2729613 RepID=UPI00145FC775|nr:hypothetical protein [Thalassotalea sp. Y01]NMP15169.1 hypothetical protein [Thalassotalea sp. Y01]
MIKKDYYRQAEFKNRFSFDEYDYRYLCEQYNNPLHYFVYRQFFILVQPDHKRRKQVARGIIDYKGLVQIAKYERKQLLMNGSTRFNRCQLIDKSGVISWEPCSRQLASHLLGENAIVESRELNELSWSELNAVWVSPQQRESMHSNNVFTQDEVKIHFEDTVLIRELVDWAQMQLGMESDKNHERQGAIRQQIEMLVREFPSLGAAALFKKIHQNFIADKDETDPLSLYLEVNKDEIIWGKSDKFQKSLSKKRFQNIVSEIKKSKN